MFRASLEQRVFSVVNTGFGAASLSFDKRGLGSAGFTIEPDRIARIPGHPQNEAFPVEVSLQTKVCFFVWVFSVSFLLSCVFPGFFLCLIVA